MAIKKISSINDELDIKLFFYIAKKNIIYAIVFLTISLTGAYLYVRYTHPIYESKVIIEISNGQGATGITNFNLVYTDDISRKIELLRSANFLERVFSKLPLDISYFSKGTVLNFEQYKTCPFEIEANVKSPGIYGIPIYINFIGQNKYSISYYIIKGASREKEFFITEKAEFPEVELTVKAVDKNAVFGGPGILAMLKRSYFFVLNNPDFIVSVNETNLNVKILDPSAQTIQISYTGENALKASDIVNVMASEFQKYDVEVKSESAYKILKYIDDQFKMTYDTVEAMQKRIDDYKVEHGLDSLSLSIKAVNKIYGRMNELENEIDNLDGQDRYLDEFSKNLSGNIDIDIYKLLSLSNISLLGDKETGHDVSLPELSGLLSSLNGLLLQKESLKMEYTVNSYTISSLDYQIDLQKKIIIENLKNFRKKLGIKEGELKEKLEKMEDITTKGTKESQSSFYAYELKNLERIYSLEEQYLYKLIELKAQYSIAKAGYVTQNVVLENSKIPTVPVSLKKNLTYLVSLIIGLVISLALILIKYLVYNEVTSLNDITKYTDAPILGVIPNYKKIIPISVLIIDKKPKSMMAECLRAIRTNLQFISSEPGPKVITITSTISREGKTFVAINLAGIIAFSDKKVLIVDFDMRRPKIHIGFDSENTKGVSTILVGKDSPEDCIEHTEFANLDFITAGPTPPNPSELILNKRMDALIQYLKTRYDFIIIDSPPIGMVTDAMKPLQLADYPIYLMKANYSKRIFIQNILRLITESNVKKLSIILNQIEPEYSTYRYKGYGYGGLEGYSSGYGGYGYGGYGYGYYEDDEAEAEEHKESFLNKLFSKIMRLKDKNDTNNT